MAILLKAIDFLCELKRYLNNLVHFFNSVHSLVCISMREAADEFITMIKSAAMIEDGSGSSYGRSTRQIGGVTLDAWTRQVHFFPMILRKDTELIHPTSYRQSTITHCQSPRSAESSRTSAT